MRFGSGWSEVPSLAGVFGSFFPPAPRNPYTISVLSLLIKNKIRWTELGDPRDFYNAMRIYNIPKIKIVVNSHFQTQTHNAARMSFINITLEEFKSAVGAGRVGSN